MGKKTYLVTVFHCTKSGGDTTSVIGTTVSLHRAVAMLCAAIGLGYEKDGSVYCFSLHRYENDRVYDLDDHRCVPVSGYQLTNVASLRGKHGGYEPRYSEHLETRERRLVERLMVNHQKVYRDWQQQQFDRSCGELELSVATSGCLTRSHIDFVGELVSYSVDGLAEKVGRRVMREIETLLEEMGLSLGLNVGAWVRPDQR